MTSRHDDHHDDAEFDAFLRGEGELSSLLREVPQPEVPRAIDDAILAQARAAMGVTSGAAANSGAANDGASGDHASRGSAAVAGVAAGSGGAGRSFALRRYRVPLALAASVVLGVSLTAQWDGWHASAPLPRMLETSPEPVPAQDAQDAAPAAAPAPVLAEGGARREDAKQDAGTHDLALRRTRDEVTRATASSEQGAPAAPRAAAAHAPESAPAPVSASAFASASAPVPAHDRPHEPPAAAAPMPESASRDVTNFAPPPPPPQPAPAIAIAGIAKPIPAPAAAPATAVVQAPASVLPSAPASSPTAPQAGAVENPVAMGRVVQPAPYLPPVAEGEAPQQAKAAARATSVSVTGRRTTLPMPLTPDQRAQKWLALLEELLDKHLDADARTIWQHFRAEYPDYPVPPALQSRIDSLPPTPDSR